MSKKEKVQTIKEMAAQKKRKLLTEKEIKILKGKGYDINSFLQGHGPLTIFDDDSDQDKQNLQSIAEKLNRKIISFKGNDA